MKKIKRKKASQLNPESGTNGVASICCHKTPLTCGTTAMGITGQETRFSPKVTLWEHSFGIMWEYSWWD